MQAQENSKEQGTSLHFAYFKKHLNILPHHYTSTDSNRLTLAYFCLSALDLLSSSSNVEDEQKERNDWIEWIYAQQVVDVENGRGGFRGGSFAGAPFDPLNSKPINEYDIPHLTMTYTALACLLILGDDLSRVKKKEILREIRELQLSNGSFPPCRKSPENDLRFLYCACCICYILKDWSLDKEQALAFIRKSKNYDGGYGQGPGLESHGGSTYCAIASLYLMGELDVNSEEHQDEEHQDTVMWLLKRQTCGFQGRVNKPEDTCYSFWIGASLDVRITIFECFRNFTSSILTRQILQASQFINREQLEAFLLTTQSKYGGFGKHPDSYPDILHSYMGLCGLSIVGNQELKRLFCPLGLSKDWK